MESIRLGGPAHGTTHKTLPEGGGGPGVGGWLRVVGVQGWVGRGGGSPGGGGLGVGGYWLVGSRGWVVRGGGS